MPPAKGGVWTNIEDEILKVSVSKYGLNQWARVSSLQPRKTAKQCKARWQEWLDPSIKKTEWSKDEDEKLLHLAKVMPTQWRTIASRVGRTATQCLERYQRLLDDAEAREQAGDDGFGLAGPAGEEGMAPSADSVRRLRPGEMDPNPESKPAKPDTIDMDEDEKEMLSEARARLANTQGKKAKRKARERQLEKSKMMANLQKWREMKEAGIAIAKKPLKKGQMDYNADIPFETAPAPGFYDTTEELERNERQKDGFDPRKRSITTKRKNDGTEEPDERKKRKDEKAAAAAQAAQAAAQAAKMQRLREAEQSSKRRTLVLPAPQVGESELDQIVKMSMSGARASQHAQGSENDATRGLIGDYTKMVDATPIRTPKVAQNEDRIANEARFALASGATQSALLGGENTPMVEMGVQRPGEHGSELRTPNPMATPLRTDQRSGSTPLMTPRDSFNLNGPGDSRARSGLRAQLASLPKPKETEWELEIPEEQTVAETKEELVEDAAVRDAREAARKKAAFQAELERQSSVVQLGLPRPGVVNVEQVANMLVDRSRSEDRMNVDGDETSAGKEGGEEEENVWVLKEIGAEMAKIMAADAGRFGGKVIGRAGPLSMVEKDELHKARVEIAFECGEVAESALVDVLASRTRLPGLEGYDSDSEDEEDEDENGGRDKAMERAFWAVHARVLSLAEECNGLEKKLGVRLGGYVSRDRTLREKLGAKAAEREERDRQVVVWERMVEVNGRACEDRLDRLRDAVAVVKRREREAQELYRARVGV